MNNLGVTKTEEALIFQLYAYHALSSIKNEPKTCKVCKYDEVYYSKLRCPDCKFKEVRE